MEFKDYLKKLKKDTDRSPANEKELGFKIAVKIIYAKFFDCYEGPTITMEEVKGIDFGESILLSESEKKKVFEVFGSCYKKDRSEFTEKERESVQDSFIDWVETNNLSFGGGLR